MQTRVLLKELMLRNFLSFGPEADPVPLQALNVMVGPNGSGKSNFIEALRLLQATPDDLAEPIREGGGIGEWVHKGGSESQVRIEAKVSNRLLGSSGRVLGPSLRHTLVFEAHHQWVRVREEHIHRLPRLLTDAGNGVTLYTFENGQGHVRRARSPELTKLPNSSGHSVLAELRDADTYPEVSHLARSYKSMRLYREWWFGPQSPLRTPQKPDLPNDFLAEDYRNLFLVLNQLEAYPEVEEQVLERLRDLMPGVRRLRLNIEGGSVQLYLVERANQIPATRISDGTLRWLCLLVILLHPKPPRLVVIEEPELGLHPDLLPILVDLLKDAAQRTQLIITTHSDILIDALTETPESVLVADKENGQTRLRRLNGADLSEWLNEYRLGRIWMKGVIGGTRW